MTAHPPLDLAALDPPVWHVASGDQAHGPFTLGQLQGFVRAGRIGPNTRLSSGDGMPFGPARDVDPLKPALAEALAARAARLSGAANFLVVSRGEAGAESRTRRTLSLALNPLGRFTETLPGTFLLRSRLSLAAVRRALADAAGGQAIQLFIVEVRDGRLGWLDLPEGTGAQVRDIWNAPLD